METPRDRRKSHLWPRHEPPCSGFTHAMVCKRFPPLKTSTTPPRVLNDCPTAPPRLLNGACHESSTSPQRQSPRALHDNQATFRGKVGRMPSEMPKKPVRYGGAAAINELASENAKGRAAGTGRRSRLYLWLRAHHGKLVAEFGRNGPSWSQVARQLGNHGVLDGAGKQPAPETVRATWYRVRRDLAAARAGRSAPPRSALSTLPSAVPAVAHPPPFPKPVDPPAGDTDPPQRKFGLAQLRGHPSSAPAPPPPVPEPERIRRSPEEVERIIADMLSGAPKNPFRRDKGD